MARPRGCTRLGVDYAIGTGMTKDASRATVLYDKACSADDAEACALLGILYADGTGVGRDERRAALLLEKACVEGASEVCENREILRERQQGRDAGPEERDEKER